MRLSGYTHTTSDWKERTSKAKMESVSLMRQTLNDELSDRRKEMADEVEAKARQARGIRKAELAVREKAIATVTTRNRKIADTLRHETDVLFHRDLKRANEGKPRATLEDLTTLSKQLSVAMKKQGNDYWIKASPPSARARRRLPPPRSPPPISPAPQLFHHMDDDGSGKICYEEFSGMVREELHVSSRLASDATLQAAWLTLDDDSSG